jgi:hypothetical protein
MERIVFILGKKRVHFSLDDTRYSIGLLNRNVEPHQPLSISFFPADTLKPKIINKAISSIPLDPNDPHKKQRAIEELNRKHLIWTEKYLCSSEIPCPLKTKIPRLCRGIKVETQDRGSGLVPRTVGEARLAAIFNKYAETITPQVLGLLLKTLGAHCFNIR